VVTVLALPINLTSGLFGMNVGGIPLADNRLGFEIVAVILISLTLVLAYIAFLKRKD
jgi:zinc transporter